MNNNNNRNAGCSGPGINNIFNNCVTYSVLLKKQKKYGNNSFWDASYVLSKTLNFK